jgi:hypothetical protein
LRSCASAAKRCWCVQALIGIEHAHCIYTGALTSHLMLFVSVTSQFFVLASVFVAYLIFREPPRVVRHVIQLNARLSDMFQKVGRQNRGRWPCFAVLPAHSNHHDSLRQSVRRSLSHTCRSSCTHSQPSAGRMAPASSSAPLCLWCSGAAPRCSCWSLCACTLPLCGHRFLRRPPR